MVVVLVGCHPPLASEPTVLRAPPPSEAERYCAWFGDARGDTLYFGAAPFWWALRAAGGDPLADLRVPGPQIVGRFDLAGLRFLEPLDVSEPGARGGVWDVLAHPNGRVYFTTYFGPMGIVDPGTGGVQRLAGAGEGLNELALGEEGAVLVTRYGGDASQGSVVVLGEDGGVRAEHLLAPVAGLRAAAKSVAYDPVRREIWVNTDLFPTEGGDARRAVGHDLRVLDALGRQILRIEHPEVPFMAFGPDGTGWFAERDGPRLRLRIRPPERASRPLLTGRIVALDDAFPAELDFVQEIRPAPDGSALVTRWSGTLHRVWPDGRVEDVELPRLERGGLYYTGVIHDGRLCATYCGEVAVVCRALP